MPNYRRAHVAGGTFFFTVVTYCWRELFHLEANRKLLGEAIRACQRDWPFEVNAIGPTKSCIAEEVQRDMELPNLPVPCVKEGMNAQ